MVRVLEAVPNFSTADPDVVAKLADAAGGTLLDVHSDADHGRTVLTLAARPDELLRAVLATATVAVANIDLRAHSGVHPRMGALDVLPIVPLRRADIAAASDLVPELVAGLARLGVPVRFYDAAHPEGRHLPAARQPFETCRGPFDGGPPAAHPRAGATALGVRGVLVAYNMTTDAGIAAAKAAATALRGANSGLAGVRALGLSLSRQAAAQISCNLTRPITCGIPQVWLAAAALLDAHGARLTGEELVGLAPDAARGAHFPTGSLEAALSRAGLPDEVEEAF